MTTVEGSDPTEALRIGGAVARDALLDVLASADFRQVTGPGVRWRGALTYQPASEGDGSARTTLVEIVLQGDFPFAAPKVLPLSRGWAEQVTGRTFGDNYYEASNGWHRDLDRAMCLFTQADHTQLPWADGEQLLDQARAWLAQDAAGWSDDAPALDLDRYLHPSAERALVLYGNLAGHEGKVLQLRRERHDVLRVGPVAAPRRQGRASGHRVWPSDTVLILDAKELGGPIRDWDDLCAAIDADAARALTRAYDDGLRKVLLLYRHRDVRGVLGLALAAGKDDEVTVKSLNTAPDDLATRTIRAHPRAESLSSKRVAVVGVGAVGSVAADLLHRSGVGELMLIDGDLVVPGNTTRHLLDGDAVGLPKAYAVANALHKARPRFGTVQWRDERLRTVADALTLLADYDVVVDATADSTATAMLTAAARTGTGQLLSACVLADGYAIRVDRTPVRDGDQPLPPPKLPPPSSDVYETGCGSPISQTPPAAVWEAAALAVRHTVGLLLNPGAVTPGEQRILAEGQNW
jgi:molybdopterin/thiamine biosynthesis adenylyltransferase